MKNMKCAVVLTFAAASTVLGASFAFANEDAVGVGDLPCSTYVKLYDERDKEGRKLLMQKVEQWAFGYMSGLNERASEGESRDLSYLSNSDLGYNILSECGYDPDLRIIEVVTTMYENALMADAGLV